MNLHLHLKANNSVIRKPFTMFETSWLCESALLTVHFMKSKSRSSISCENLASELRCTVSLRHPPGFEDLV